MTARISNWQAGPRKTSVHFLKHLAISFITNRAADVDTVTTGIGARDALMSMIAMNRERARPGPVGVRLDFESTKGRAFLELTAEPSLPAAITVLRRLRDACNLALAELEGEREKALQECHHCTGTGREPTCAVCTGRDYGPTGRRVSCARCGRVLGGYASNDGGPL